MRFGVRTLVFLGLCAAAAAASAAHVIIDIVGDYALPHDTYDDIAHSSRDLVSGLALLFAFVLAARGLRICCEIAAAYRTRLPQLASSARERAAFIFGVIVASSAVVPAMELLDGFLDGVPVRELDDAFGGSIALGLATTVFCAGLAAAAIYAVARWLVSRRDDIAAIIETLLSRSGGTIRCCGHDLKRHLLTPRRRRTPHAYRLCKRGPPRGGRYQCHHTNTSTEGDLREFRSFSRVAGATCARGDAELRRAGLRGSEPPTPDGATR